VTGARFPLPLRNALAELTIAALDDAGAAGALAWLADSSCPPGDGVTQRLAAVHLIDPGAASLLPVHAPHGDTVAAHARRALRAADAYRALRRPAAPHAETAVRQAAALWAEHLFFEVHEVLEAVWKTAADESCTTRCTGWSAIAETRRPSSSSCARDRCNRRSARSASCVSDLRFKRATGSGSTMSSRRRARADGTTRPPSSARRISSFSWLGMRH